MIDIKNNRKMIKSIDDIKNNKENDYQYRKIINE